MKSGSKLIHPAKRTKRAQERRKNRDGQTVKPAKKTRQKPKLSAPGPKAKPVRVNFDFLELLQRTIELEDLARFVWIRVANLRDRVQKGRIR